MIDHTPPSGAALGESRKMKETAKQIRVKKWLLIKNNMYAACPNQIRDGRYTENSWLLITNETEKAYHLNCMQRFVSNPWIPKSAVLEVREVERTVGNGIIGEWIAV